MNSNASLEDEYVEQFVLQFENMAVKREGHGTPDGREFRPPVPSPPHHLLTPPEQEFVQHHHQMMNGGAVSSVKPGNVIMYSNIGTPPDTPPVSNSPSPQFEQAYPLISQPRLEGYGDGMMWMQHTIARHDLLEPQPLDLRPHCNIDSEGPPTWNVIPPNHSAIAEDCKRMMLHSDYMQQMQQMSPVLSKPSTIMSPMSSSSTHRASVVNGRHSQSVLSIVGKKSGPIDDDTLISISVRDLNKRLAEFPKPQQERYKQRRRTLKNRKYAQCCRQKRVFQKTELEKANQILKTEVARLEIKLESVLQELDSYQLKYGPLPENRDIRRVASINMSYL